MLALGSDAFLSNLPGTAEARRAQSSSDLSPWRPTRKTDLATMIVRNENVSAKLERKRKLQNRSPCAKMPSRAPRTMCFMLRACVLWMVLVSEQS